MHWALRWCAAPELPVCIIFIPVAQGAPKLKVAIVGGGLAGLSTAVELLDQGYDVEIFEQRPFIGGKVSNLLCCRHDVCLRFSMFVDTGLVAYCWWCRVQVASFIDKDQNHIEMGLHVFFGCYHNLFRLMRKCGVLQNLLVKASRPCQSDVIYDFFKRGPNLTA